MGTSKGYIAPSTPEWSQAKRAVTNYIKSRDPNTRSAMVSKYAGAMRSSRSRNGNIGSSFSSSVSNLLQFARSASENGIDSALNEYGLGDLTGQSSEYILNALVNHFANGGATIEDSLSLAAITNAFDILEIDTLDDLCHVELDSFLCEVIISFVNYSFDFCFSEKISRGRTSGESDSILDDVHEYIDMKLRDRLTSDDFKRVDFLNLNSDKIVSEMLDDAFSSCIKFYGVDEN